MMQKLSLMLAETMLLHLVIGDYAKRKLVLKVHSLILQAMNFAMLNSETVSNNVVEAWVSWNKSMLRQGYLEPCLTTL